MSASDAAVLPLIDDAWVSRPTGWRAAIRSFRRFIATKRLGAAGLAIALFFFMLALGAPVVARYSPDQVFEAPNPDYKTNPSISDLAKNPNVGSPMLVGRQLSPSGEHWFGTDNAGRDIYARVVYGSRLSLIVGFGASILAVAAGVVLGVLSGFYKGWVDLVLQRFIDALQALPAIVLLLLLVQVSEPSVRNTVIAMGIVGIPLTTRLVRAGVLGISANDYVLAARSVGASDARIMARHVLPNIAAILLIIFSIGIGAYILFEATISFLGVGPRNVVSWGKMVQEGRAAIDLHPWQSIFAGGAIASLVVGFNLLGDALRDWLDPRLTGR